MPRQRLHIGTCAAALALVMLAALLPSAAAGGNAATSKCKSSDLRYPFRPGGPNDFGVFKLRITGGKCRTARRVARTWMKRFEADLEAGRVKLPRSVEGFRFETLPPNAAQTYRERGRRGDTTIRFNYRVPNG